MAERQTIQLRMEPLALKRLDALGRKLTMTRTAVIHLALARLAEMEKVEHELFPDDRPG